VNQTKAPRDFEEVWSGTFAFFFPPFSFFSLPFVPFSPPADSGERTTDERHSCSFPHPFFSFSSLFSFPLVSSSWRSVKDAEERSVSEKACPRQGCLGVVCLLFFFSFLFFLPFLPSLSPLPLFSPDAELLRRNAQFLIGAGD